MIFPKIYPIALTKNEYATASLNGTRLKISYFSLEKAISITAWLRYALLREQYGIENVEIKILRS